MHLSYLIVKYLTNWIRHFGHYPTCYCFYCGKIYYQTHRFKAHKYNIKKIKYIQDVIYGLMAKFRLSKSLNIYKCVTIQSLCARTLNFRVKYNYIL